MSLNELEPIDALRAVELLEKALTERGPDYVYRQPVAGEGCVYIYDGQPSCMVGFALALHGIPIEQIEATKNVLAGGLPDVLPLVKPEAAAVFDEAQWAQDTGVPWGAALEKARVKARQFGVSV